ncbi:hypothetical protein ICM05_07655 [Leucobacter sp. cx-42]|uniref:hypothetical protein n=1 Tax=unclassified Leucobacter TaxID=2621730 RepID=UPI00165D7098|nr:MULTISPECIES: hypothetical protein [unclassified Leucobacter]MBC9954518.1 hypothetical protein [Leucobacter sp. cx-42]
MQRNFIQVIRSTRSTPRDTRRAIAVVAAGAIAFGALTGCAPEPEIDAPDDLTTQIEDETKWPELDKETEKVTVLPADFPETFPVPESAKIYDVGSRNAGTWFLVLVAQNAAEAETLWQQVITDGSFEVADAAETTEGGTSATLTSDDASVDAMTLPQEDGTVLMNYDITVFSLMP